MMTMFQTMKLRHFAPRYLRRAAVRDEGTGRSCFLHCNTRITGRQRYFFTAYGGVDQFGTLLGIKMANFLRDRSEKPYGNAYLNSQKPV